MEDKIQQRSTKLLPYFIDQFQRERILLPTMPNNWPAIAFTRNLNENSSKSIRKLKDSLREFLPKTWNDVYPDITLNFG